MDSLWNYLYIQYKKGADAVLKLLDDSKEVADTLSYVIVC